MQGRKTLLTVAVAALMALSCVAILITEDSVAASASATKEGVTVVYTESESGASLHFSFASGSTIKGDNVDTVINERNYGKLDLLMIPDVSLGAKCALVEVSLSQDGHDVSLTLRPGSGYAIILNQPSNGTIASNVNSAEPGTTVKLTATPDTGYTLSRWVLTPSVTVTNNQFIMPANDVKVTAEFTAVTDTHFVSVEGDVYGTVSASPILAEKGRTITLTVTPVSQEYEFKEWKSVSPSNLKITKVNDTTYTFIMPESDVSVKASFQAVPPHTYTVKTSPTDGGSISPSTGTAKVGTIVKFDVSPKDGYAVGGIVSTPSVEFTSVGGSYCFVMPASDIAVTVNLVAAKTYEVSVSAGTGGKVTADAVNAIEGQKVTLKVTADSGYVFDSWIKAPSSLAITKVDTNTYTFIMPAKDVSVTASFKAAKEYGITVSAGSGGKIVSDSSRAFEGQIVKVTLTPDKGYAFDSWTVMTPAGLKINKLQTNVYFFEMPGSNVSLTASFKVMTEVVAEVENGSASVRIGGNVTQDTVLSLSITRISPTLKNIPQDAVTYNVYLTAKNGTQSVNLSNNIVTLCLDPSTLDISKTIYAYYVSDDGKTVEKMKASLTEDGDIKFTVSHFSMYVLTYGQIEPLEDADNTMLMIIGIVVVIVVLMVAVAVFSRRKTKV